MHTAAHNNSGLCWLVPLVTRTVKNILSPEFRPFCGATTVPQPAHVAGAALHQTPIKPVWQMPTLALLATPQLHLSRRVFQELRTVDMAELAKFASGSTTASSSAHGSGGGGGRAEKSVAVAAATSEGAQPVAAPTASASASFSSGAAGVRRRTHEAERWRQVLNAMRLDDDQREAFAQVEALLGCGIL